MDWPANADALAWFMDEVWPRVGAARPGARFVAVGRNPPARLVQEAARRGLAWTFTGFVDDVRPHVEAARVSVVPLRVGGGTRIKVYEAMALGRPVVATAIGVEGLPVESGRHFLLADRADDFAAAVVRLLADDGLTADLATAARAFVERHASSAAVARAFEEVCARAAGLG
jgi:glycosyltransferase involved in cell wall biosynthesis